MSPLRVLAAVILPPLAVIDRGVKPILLVALLTFLGWIPGVVAALIYSSGPLPRRTL
ncbi:MAG: YqaE/Pmp3 family membrane protein [Fimbriimonadaceae bacterium]|nr:YqaE/Pmp3 family membrane protein [Fimbriimonadaceae bacterium]